MLEKCVLTILEFNRNQRLGNRRTKLNICHHMFTSFIQLQIRSFHVVERTRTFSKCQKMKNARAKRAKILFSIVKYANLWGFCCRRRRGCLSSLFTPRARVGYEMIEARSAELAISIFHYIHTEVYTLKSRRVNFRSQADVNQSNVAYCFSHM